MHTLLQTDNETIVSIIDDFNIAWNERDLNKMSSFFAEDIVHIHPAIKIGFLNFSRKEIHGLFKLLQFWKNFFEKYKSTKEDKKVIDIKKDGDLYKVTCDAHNYGLKVSCKLILYFNERLLINKMAFTEVTKFKGKEKLSIPAILLKQFKAKFFSN